MQFKKKTNHKTAMRNTVPSISTKYLSEMLVFLKVMYSKNMLTPLNHY